MKKLNSIAVFCGSSEGNDLAILKDAQLLGRHLANEHITLVYGGSKIGIMGAVAKAVLDNSGKVIGVIPEFLKLKEVVHLGLDELITTESMHERKLKMHELAEGFIAMPGGLGTLEELFEILTWSQLGLHKKPIGLLNSNHFYDGLVDLLEHMALKGFVRFEDLELLIVHSDIEILLSRMLEYKPSVGPSWLKKNRT